MKSTSDNTYDFHQIESHWQRVWDDYARYSTKRDPSRAKYFVCDFLPTPNGPLHMGHSRVYILGDVSARYRVQRGYDVLHPQTFDSFGLPIEIEAFKTGTHPLVLATHYSQIMWSQFKRMGYATSYKNTFSMCDPKIYRWTQGLFKKLLAHDLAYRKEGLVNYCPRCNTSLAYEQVESGRCWRCSTPVEGRVIHQWYYRTTKFAGDLLNGLEKLPDWPEQMRSMQLNWIGRSDGVLIQFPIERKPHSISVFTTRPEGLFGTTFLALSPLHPLARQLLGKEEIKSLLAEGVADKDFKVKAGRRLDIRAIHPYTGESLPVYVANYVQDAYAEGAIAGVPGHDARDAEFAELMQLPVKYVTTGQPLKGKTAHQLLDSTGLTVHSGQFSGLSIDNARQKIIADIEERSIGRTNVQYHLRDWCVSRQRYWGTPIPVVYCEGCGVIPVADEDLPVLLPLNVMPSFAGNPLADCRDFTTCRCPACNRPARRETDTMDTYCDSSWYVFRCCSPDYQAGMFDREAIKSWMPIDLGVGGVDTINFILYTRFICRALKEMGEIDVVEPFLKLLIQYPILRDGQKMAKRLKNVVAPDGIIEQYGADTLRLFVMSLTAPSKPIEWKEDQLQECFSLLNDFWHIAIRNLPFLSLAATDRSSVPGSIELSSTVFESIQSITDAYERGRYNVIVRRVRELVHAMQRFEKNYEIQANAETARSLLASVVIVACRLLAPIAPHVTQDLWHRSGQTGLIEDSDWPDDGQWTGENSPRAVVVQLDGIKQFRISVSPKTTESEILSIVQDEIPSRRIMPSTWSGRYVFFRGKKFDVLNMISGEGQ